MLMSIVKIVSPIPIHTVFLSASCFWFCISVSILVKRISSWLSCWLDCSMSWLTFLLISSSFSSILSILLLSSSILLSLKSARVSSPLICTLWSCIWSSCMHTYSVFLGVILSGLFCCFVFFIEWVSEYCSYVYLVIVSQEAECVRMFCIDVC